MDKTLLYHLAVVDDSNFVRTTFKDYFHRDKKIYCVKTYYNTVNFIEDLKKGIVPDILVLDINLFGVSSLNSIPEIRELAPDLKIIIYTSYEEPEFLIKALRLGVCGYLLKSNNLYDIELELLEFAKGTVKITNKMAHKLSLHFRNEKTTLDSGIEALTNREMEVLKLLSEGFEYDEIAEKMGLVINGVRSHIKAIYRKLQVKNGIQAAKRYIESKELFIENEDELLKNSQ